MRHLAFLFALLTGLLFAAPTPAATTQATKQNQLAYVMTSQGFPASQVALFLGGTANVLYYDTAAELLAATPTEGKIGYAIDTNAFYLRAGAAWVGLSTTDTLTGSNGGTVANGTNNAWTFAENSEDLVLTFGSNSATWSSSTGVAAFNLGVLPLSWTNGGTINNDTNGAITIGEAGEDLITAFTSNAVTVSSSTGVSTVTYSGIGVTAPVIGTALKEIRFCGNGPNGSTATYLGPVLESTYGADMSYAGAGCAALDNTTEGTADAPYDAIVAYKPVALMCATTCGTSDTMTVQLRSAVGDVTGITCAITLTGSPAQCVVRTAAPPTIAAGATMAVKVVNSGTDNCTAGHMECRLYVTY